MKRKHTGRYTECPNECMKYAMTRNRSGTPLDEWARVLERKAAKAYEYVIPGHFDAADSDFVTGLSAAAKMGLTELNNDGDMERLFVKREVEEDEGSVRRALITGRQRVKDKMWEQLKKGNRFGKWGERPDDCGLRLWVEEPQWLLADVLVRQHPRWGDYSGVTAVQAPTTQMLMGAKDAKEEYHELLMNEEVKNPPEHKCREGMQKARSGVMKTALQLAVGGVVEPPGGEVQPEPVSEHLWYDAISQMDVKTALGEHWHTKEPKAGPSRSDETQARGRATAATLSREPDQRTVDLITRPSNLQGMKYSRALSSITMYEPQWQRVGGVSNIKCTDRDRDAIRDAAMKGIPVIPDEKAPSYAKMKKNPLERRALQDYTGIVKLMAAHGEGAYDQTEVLANNDISLCPICNSIGHTEGSCKLRDAGCYIDWSKMQYARIHPATCYDDKQHKWAVLGYDENNQLKAIPTLVPLIQFIRNRSHACMPTQLPPVIKGGKGAPMPTVCLNDDPNSATARLMASIMTKRRIPTEITNEMLPMGRFVPGRVEKVSMGEGRHRWVSLDPNEPSCGVLVGYHLGHQEGVYEVAELRISWLVARHKMQVLGQKYSYNPKDPFQAAPVPNTNDDKDQPAASKGKSAAPSQKGKPGTSGSSPGASGGGKKAEVELAGDEVGGCRSNSATKCGTKVNAMTVAQSDMELDGGELENLFREEDETVDGAVADAGGEQIEAVAAVPETGSYKRKRQHRTKRCRNCRTMSSQCAITVEGLKAANRQLKRKIYKQERQLQVNKAKIDRERLANHLLRTVSEELDTVQLVKRKLCRSLQELVLAFKTPPQVRYPCGRSEKDCDQRRAGQLDVLRLVAENSADLATITNLMMITEQHRIKELVKMVGAAEAAQSQLGRFERLWRNGMESLKDSTEEKELIRKLIMGFSPVSTHIAEASRRALTDAERALVDRDQPTEWDPISAAGECEPDRKRPKVSTMMWKLPQESGGVIWTEPEEERNLQAGSEEERGQGKGTDRKSRPHSSSHRESSRARRASSHDGHRRSEDARDRHRDRSEVRSGQGASGGRSHQDRTPAAANGSHQPRGNGGQASSYGWDGYGRLVDTRGMTIVVCRNWKCVFGKCNIGIRIHIASRMFSGSKHDTHT